MFTLFEMVVYISISTDNKLNEKHQQLNVLRIFGITWNFNWGTNRSKMICIGTKFYLECELSHKTHSTLLSIVFSFSSAESFSLLCRNYANKRFVKVKYLTIYLWIVYLFHQPICTKFHSIMRSFFSLSLEQYTSRKYYSLLKLSLQSRRSCLIWLFIYLNWIGLIERFDRSSKKCCELVCVPDSVHWK